VKTKKRKTLEFTKLTISNLTFDQIKKIKGAYAETKVLLCCQLEYSEEWSRCDCVNESNANCIMPNTYTLDLEFSCCPVTICCPQQWAPV
jgi:hypothetical protein